MTVALYQITATITAWNGTNVNVWHTKRGGGTTSDASLAAATIQQFYDTVKAQFAASATISVDKCIDLSVSPPQYVPITVPALVTSTGSGRSDARLACCISWRTNVATRRGRGRTFIGPLNSSANSTSTGLLASAVTSGLQTGANALLTALATGSVDLQVYSRAANVGYTPSAAIINSTPDTLRSRTLR